jgi:mRNA interferase MazF
MSGEVVWANIPGDKIRPVVILTRTHIVRRLHSVLVAPVTSTVRHIATEVPVGADEGVRDGSVANLDNILLLNKSALGRPCGKISPERWSEFCKAAGSMMSC